MTLIVLIKFHVPADGSIVVDLDVLDALLDVGARDQLRAVVAQETRCACRVVTAADIREKLGTRHFLFQIGEEVRVEGVRHETSALRMSHRVFP